MIVKNGINCVMLLCNGREMAEQSLRLDGRKVCNIKMVGLSQAESNKATVCALPSIHLPLTREASVIVLWRKRSYFKTMRMQGRLTLHVHRLVHISQVSGVF